LVLKNKREIGVFFTIKVVIAAEEEFEKEKEGKVREQSMKTTGKS